MVRMRSSCQNAKHTYSVVNSYIDRKKIVIKREIKGRYRDVPIKISQKILPKKISGVANLCSSICYFSRL